MDVGEPSTVVLNPPAVDEEAGAEQADGDALDGSEGEDGSDRPPRVVGPKFGTEFDDDSWDNGMPESPKTNPSSPRSPLSSGSSTISGEDTLLAGKKKKPWHVSDAELKSFINTTRSAEKKLKKRMSILEDPRRQMMKALPFPNFDPGAPIRLNKLERGVPIPCRETGRRSVSALDDRIDVMVSLQRFQLKVECFNDTLVGLGPTSLKGLVQQATGIDPRAMRLFFMQCPMNADDRTVSSYGIGNNAMVALRMATISEPNLRPSMRAYPHQRPERPEKWLEEKAGTLVRMKDAILSDEVTLVQKWTTLPASQNSSPLARAPDLRQASDLIYMKDFQHGSYEEGPGGGRRAWDGLSGVRNSIAKLPHVHARKADAARGARTMTQSIRYMANRPVPAEEIFDGWQRVLLKRQQEGGRKFPVGGIWNRVPPGARNVLPG